jgi:hypothetical protein
MALSQTYGKLEIPGIGVNEPAFIPRGQDALAQSAVEFYRLLAEAHGCKVTEALKMEMRSFRHWPGERRLPAWPTQSQATPKGRIEPAWRGLITAD